MKLSSILLFFGVLLLIPACKEDSLEAMDIYHRCDPDTVYFEQDVFPILKSRCGIPACHNDLSACGDVIIMDYSSLMKSQIITPGQPKYSGLWISINDTDPSIRMPLTQKSLDSAQLLLIKTWIEQGALGNRCTP
ncbi:MAG: hypothetical protein GC180_13060 [Bacteroidetes bacterium]|nr:hypothetical protein [Bacteroidota bacterium]